MLITIVYFIEINNIRHITCHNLPGELSASCLGELSSSYAEANLGIMNCFHLSYIKGIFLEDVRIIIVMTKAQIDFEFIPTK